MEHPAAIDASLRMCTQAAETRAREAEEEVDRAEQDAASARAETRNRTGFDDSGNSNSLPESNANRAAAAEQQASMLAAQLQVHLLLVWQLSDLVLATHVWLLTDVDVARGPTRSHHLDSHLKSQVNGGALNVYFCLPPADTKQSINVHSWLCRESGRKHLPSPHGQLNSSKMPKQLQKR